ncbi:MAG: HDOD domain-containing protein [Fibrobacterota bacterium]
MTKTVQAFISDTHEKKILSVLFETYGFRFAEQDNVSGAYLHIVQMQPDYIIVELPERLGDHLHLIKQLRANTKTRSIPILCYGDIDTSDPVTHNAFKEAGVEHFFPRPLRVQMLKKVIPLHPNSEKGKHSIAEYEGELEDTGRIMDPRTSAIERIEIMEKRIGDLLAFPFTVAKVLRITESSTGGARDLAKAIEVDPVVVSNVLKVSNSVAYGRAGARISSVRDAIVRMGFTETKNIALSLSVMNLFSDEERSVGFSRQHFWFHSLTCAIIAGKLAHRARYPEPEVAFLGGLLHDFGVILLDEFFPEYLLATLKSTNTAGISFLRVQRKLWGMTHNDVVVRLFSQWNLPDELAEVLRNLEYFHEYENSRSPALEKLVYLVGIADIIAKSISFGRECDEFVLPPGDDLMKKLKIPVKLQKTFFESIAQELQAFGRYLNLESDDIAFPRSPDEEDQAHTLAFIDRSGRIFSPVELALTARGETLHPAQNAEDIFAHDTIPDAVILLPSGENTNADITEFADLKKAAENGQAQPIPLLIIGDVKEAPQEDHIAVLPEEIDMRILLFALENLIGQTPFTYERPEITPVIPQNAPPPPKKEKAFSFSARIVDDSIVVTSLKGPLRMSRMKQIKQMMVMLLNKTKKIVLDLTESTDIDIRLLESLSTLAHAMEKKGGKILLTTRTLPEDPQIRTYLREAADDDAIIAAMEGGGSTEERDTQQ